MLPIYTILHPTDFSDRSQFAFNLASALARDYGASLVVLHVVPEPALVFSDGIIPPPTEPTKEKLRRQLLHVEVADPDVQVSHQLEEGNPASEILRVAQAIGADLIIMGTHGRRGLDRILMGSVAEQVLRKAHCPVLTVKTPFPDWSPVVEEPVMAASHS